ncbi:hypothetical protein JCM11641_004737 [Rhodosporidiobolus odoratus]
MRRSLHRPVHTPEDPPRTDPVSSSRTSSLSPRAVALILLVVQNASVSLLTRLSRSQDSGRDLYNPAVAVFTAELLKALISLAMAAKSTSQRGDDRGSFALAWSALSDLGCRQKIECAKLAFPAALYGLQNTMLYTALSNLDAATYQTTYQLKLLTAALFSVIFFRRRLSAIKWTALLLLVIGVAIVQLDSVEPSSAPAMTQDPRKGFAAIFAACMSSGLAGNWFEWVLKTGGTRASQPASRIPGRAPPSALASASPTSTSLSACRSLPPSLWTRNLQLAIPSLLFSFGGILLSSQFRHAWHSPGLVELGKALLSAWTGFSPLVWGVVAHQAAGGLLVAVVVREADGVAKGFATSVAIIVSTCLSAVFSHVVPGRLFLLGASLVICSTALYSRGDD